MDEIKSCRECAFGFMDEENLLAKRNKGLIFCRWLTVNRDVLPKPIYMGYGLDIRPLIIDWHSPISDCEGFTEPDKLKANSGGQGKEE